MLIQCVFNQPARAILSYSLMFHQNEHSAQELSQSKQAPHSRMSVMSPTKIVAMWSPGPNQANLRPPRVR